MKSNQSLSPVEVLGQVAQALPESARQHVIIIGSLAAGYHFYGNDGARAVRTKDVDCMFSPHAKAVAVAQAVTEQLFQANWQPRQDGAWNTPGTAEQPEDQLPMVRLRPPPELAKDEWFIELLGAPMTPADQAQTKTLERVETSRGHFALCSFQFLALTEWQPLPTATGLRIARPEMMALANLLHHQAIGRETMSGEFFGANIKRSNKDLGRVLALAYLQGLRDSRNSSLEMDAWAGNMASALREKFPSQAPELAARAGNGLRDLLASPEDLDQALRTCNLGLLAGADVGREEILATGRRVLADVIEPLAEAFEP